MCGIVAIVASQAVVTTKALSRATGSLRHRGPDAQRHWIADHGCIGLGHSRLSIIDLTTGDQPIASENGLHHIVVNGEFYGFEAIRQQLQAQGHVFNTRSDSEIALHLYEECGTRCLHWLRGEFAFALWDEANQTLFAARDRFGIKPLFYAVHEGALYLASEVKALFAAGVPARWDYETLYQFHSTMMHPPDRTLYAGVYAIPPGHYLLASGTHARLVPYWDFDYPSADPTSVPPDPQACIEQLSECLHEAVRLRLRADVPVACYLSGGLDSCAVLGVAMRYSTRPLRAFTLSFDTAHYDERAIAEEMAERAGAEFSPIEIRSSHLAEHFSDALWNAEYPFGNAHAVAKYLLSRAVHNDGIKVVLTGEGSDEVFAGYPHYRRDLVLYDTPNQDEAARRRLLAELQQKNAVSRGILMPSGDLAGLSGVHQMIGFVPSFFEVWGEAGSLLNGLLAPEFAMQYRQRDPFRVILNHLDVQRQMSGRHPVHQSLYLWAKTLLPDYILTNLGDRMEMAHSVEGRLPFLDHHLVEQVVKMPVSMKIRDMTEKYVLREAAKPVLTETVYQRQKHPFLSPPSTLQLTHPLFDLVQDTLRSPMLEAVGIYDRKAVIKMLDELPTLDEGRRTQLDLVVTFIASVCILHQRFYL